MHITVIYTCTLNFCNSSITVYDFQNYHRGLSSTVRKCVSRDSGIEYAVKIIDKSQDEAITESIAAEMQVLSYLPEHKHISKFQGWILLIT
jgi:serine/threonine protein kinase